MTAKSVSNLVSLIKEVKNGIYEKLKNDLIRFEKENLGAGLLEIPGAAWKRKMEKRKRGENALLFELSCRGGQARVGDGSFRE